MQYCHNHSEEQERVILLAHHPFRKHYSYGLFNIGFSGDELNIINNFLKDYKDKIAFQFAGHSHDKKNRTSDFYDIMSIVETDANIKAPLARLVQFSSEGTVDYSKMLGQGITITSHSPVDLIITDPDGLATSKQINEIPGASYFEEDIDEDDEPDDIIEIPERKMGKYQIRVIPEDGAVPEDTYTLEVSTLENTFGYVPILLAENTPISEIPTEPYIFQSKEREATQITYTGELNGQYSDQVNLSAILIDADGSFLANKTVIFQIGEQSISAITNENGVASTMLTLNQIPGQYYLVEADFVGDEDYLPAFDSKDFVIKTAKSLKQDVILELEQAKTDNKKFNKEIDKIIWFINQSLNENLWLDASRLAFFEKGNCNNLNLEKILDKDELDIENISLKCLKSGIVAFYYEKMAVKLMMPKPVFETVIEKLVKADKLLAQVSLFDAKNTPIKNLKLQKIIENQIKKAEQEIQKAEMELQKNKPDKAITRFSKSWLHSQLAIKLANL